MRRLIVTAVLGVLGVSGSAWVWWELPPPRAQHSRGVNAVWLKHDWVGKPHDGGEYDALAHRLQLADISDALFHAGPLARDGSLDPARHTNAAGLIAAMHQRAPGIRVQAYLGGKDLDLSDQATRDNALQAATTMLDAGFDGIHYDIEPVYPDDDGFLRLLADTHDLTRQRQKILSAAVEQMEVLPGSQRVIQRVDDRYHDPTRRFLRQVARRVDQIDIMTYDTGLPTDFLFGVHMAWQTEHVARTLRGINTTIIMGVPTYEHGTRWGFHPWAENVRSGIRGVRKGLAHVPKAQRGRIGIGLFAEWTTSDDEWRTFQRDWVSP